MVGFGSERESAYACGAWRDNQLGDYLDSLDGELDDMIDPRDNDDYRDRDIWN